MELLGDRFNDVCPMALDNCSGIYREAIENGGQPIPVGHVYMSAVCGLRPNQSRGTFKFPIIDDR
jgi:hypothetical protein